jgi:uncharacterized membrane protein YedE/YeeE
MRPAAKWWSSLADRAFGDSSGQPDMILSLSMILAVVIGFSIQRASICMVKAVAEILTTHRAFMLISFAKTIVWIELVTIPLTWLFPDVRANRHMLGFSWAAVTGGIVFGIGAAVNRACAISILSHLGEGELSMLLTIAAMLFGAAIAADMAGLSNSAIQQPLANLDEPSTAAACFLVLASAWAARDVWRLWRAWPEGASLGQILLASPYRLSAAAAVLGISNGVVYALHGSWAYTTAIQREIGLGATESEKPGADQWLLVGSLLAGAAFSAIQRGRFQLAWRPSAAWAQNIIGGALMGFGAFFIPGGNDVLLLQGIPSLSPPALLALVAMIIGIAATIIVIRFVTGEYMRIRCVSDACIVESEAETIALPMRRG